jgi:hypothetical protein
MINIYLLPVPAFAAGLLSSCYGCCVLLQVVFLGLSVVVWFVPSFLRVVRVCFVCCGLCLRAGWGFVVRLSIR